jgi:dTDP-4-dehydrorhamnose 3,5-epimerase
VTFEELAIPGVFAIDAEPAVDERGLFVRTFDRSAFAERGLELGVAQASVSYNTRRGTLRGLHLQVPPHEEAKLVRCVSGSAFDVVVDLRSGSPTQLRWLWVELSAERRNAIYIPPGLAHGFLTLEDRCELEYLISVPHEPAAAVGVRWDDPAVSVEWPFPPTVLSERDEAFPDLDISRVRDEGPAGLS